MFATKLFPTVLVPLALTVSAHGLNTQRTFAVNEHAPALSYSYPDTYDAGSFSPLEHLHLIPISAFVTLSHPAFPKYAVRVKQSQFCDGNVSAYTGYIDVEAKHLFFYFFESRSDPDSDDVIFWTNGGPGGSSSLGLFTELGPCRFISGNTTAHNPYSWNEHANIFFIDQPVGVGFSYAEHGESVNTSQEAGKDIAAFVAIFFEHFGTFKGRAFHMAGESYGGVYVPTYASAVYDQNAKLKELGMTPINLLGNGCTEDLTMLPSYYDMQCLNTTIFPISDIATCVQMKRVIPRCEKWLRESCVDAFDTISCGAALSFCNDNIVNPVLYSGVNPYDLSKACDGSISETYCYPIFDQVATYLNTSHMREALGVDPAVGDFYWASWDVNEAFTQSLDRAFPSQLYIAALLERGIRALVYVGDTDFLCNWIGNERMTLGLEWTGQTQFTSAPLRKWMIGGEAAGVTRSFGPLTFATISEAGHMAPYDQPERSLELTRRWVAGETL